MSVISEAQFTNVVQPGLKKVFIGEFNNVPQGSLIGPMYDMVQSDKKDEDFLEIEDIGNFPVFTGEVDYTEFREGNTKTLTPIEYALGLKLQRRLIDDDLYNVINQQVRQMGTSARYRMEQDAAGPFIHAFDGTYTVFDGLSLCNSAHTFVSTASTQSNSGSSPFSFAALDATLNIFRKYKNSQNRFILDVYPTQLMGPVELQTQFAEVIDSKLKAYTSNNEINVFEREFSYMTTPFLTDTNDWFLIDRRKMKNWLKWIQRIPLEFKDQGDFDTYTRKYAAYMRYTNSPLHWLWVYGHQVS